MMCDVLPLLSRLSRAFQSSDVELSVMHKHVTLTMTSLSSLTEYDAPYSRKFDADLQSLQSDLASYHSSYSVELTLNMIISDTL